MRDFKKYIYTAALIVPYLGLAQKESIRIATVFNFTDSINKTTPGYQKGFEVATKLFSKRNPQYNVTIKKFPINQDLSSITTAAESIIKENFKYILGPEQSRELKVLNGALKEAKILVISPTVSNPEINSERELNFSTCFSDKDTSKEIAHFVLNKLKPEKLGIIHNISDPYTNFLTTEFTKSIRSAAPNLSITTKEVLKDQASLEKEVTTMKEAGINHVSILGYKFDLDRFVEVSNQLKYFPCFIGSDGWSSSEAIYKDFISSNDNKENFCGYRNVYWMPNTPPTKLEKEFTRILREIDPSLKMSSDMAVGFDAAWVLLEAIKSTGKNASATEIAHTLRTTTFKGTLTAPQIKFTDSRMAKKKILIQKISVLGIQKVSL